MRKKKNTKTKSKAKPKDDLLVEERNLLVTEYFASKKNRQKKRELERKIADLDMKYEQLQG